MCPSRFFLERERTEVAAGSSLNATDGSTYKVEVVAKRKVSGDPQKIEEPPPDAEGGGELPLWAEDLRSMSLSTVGSTAGNSPMGNEGHSEKSTALAEKAESSGPPIAALAGVGEAGSGAGADDDGVDSHFRFSRRAQKIPDCTDLKQSVSRASKRACMSPDCANPNQAITRSKIRDEASMANFRNVEQCRGSWRCGLRRRRRGRRRRHRHSRRQIRRRRRRRLEPAVETARAAPAPQAARAAQAAVETAPAAPAAPAKVAPKEAAPEAPKHAASEEVRRALEVAQPALEAECPPRPKIFPPCLYNTLLAQRSRFVVEKDAPFSTKPSSLSNEVRHRQATQKAVGNTTGFP